MYLSINFLATAFRSRISFTWFYSHLDSYQDNLHDLQLGAQHFLTSQFLGLHLRTFAILFPNIIFMLFLLLCYTYLHYNHFFLIFTIHAFCLLMRLFFIICLHLFMIFQKLLAFHTLKHRFSINEFSFTIFSHSLMAVMFSWFNINISLHAYFKEVFKNYLCMGFLLLNHELLKRLFVANPWFYPSFYFRHKMVSVYIFDWLIKESK